MRGEKSRSFMPESKRSRVFKYLRSHPEANIYDLHFEFPKIDGKILSQYKHQWRVMYNAHNIEVAKGAMCIVFSYINNPKKCKLFRTFSQVELQAIDFLGEWCGWEEYKHNLLLEEANKIRKRG